MILLLSLFWNFYSRASYEARPKSRFLKELKIDFYSRASYEARLAGPVTMRKGEVRISTHAPHTRRDIYYGDMTGLAVISTHAPHTRRDWSRKSRFDYYWPISTHAPHTRRDLIPFYVDEVLPDFYSRASYEARRPPYSVNALPFNFYSRASYEARRADYRYKPNRVAGISTHAPHTRRD